MYFYLYLISRGHDSHHRELVDADLSHSHSSQQANLWRAHMCSFSQHTLPSPDVMTNRPVQSQKGQFSQWGC